MKQIHQVVTRGIEDQFKPGEKWALFEAFQVLVRAFPEEHHFAIHLWSAKEGQGQKVWFIIDQSEEERIETMLLPEDY